MIPLYIYMEKHDENGVMLRCSRYHREKEKERKRKRKRKRVEKGRRE